jgi:hypothetical protein
MKGLTILVAGLTAAAVSYFLYIKSKADQVSSTTVAQPSGVTVSSGAIISSTGEPTAQLKGGTQPTMADTHYVLGQTAALAPNSSFRTLLVPQTSRFQRLS